MRRILPGLALTLLLVPTLHAQSTVLPPLTAHVDVKIVNVDVTVTDRDGNPVTGLTQSDFEVYEDGQPQTVRNFYAIQHPPAGRPATESVKEAAPAVLPQFRRKIALLVDNNYIDKMQRDEALRKIDAFIDDTYDAESEWAVAVIGQHLQLLQPFTRDRAEIHKAVAAARATPAYSTRGEMNRAILSDPDRRKEQTAGTGVSNANLAQYKESVRFQAREQTYRALRAVSGTARAVSEMSRAYAAADGRKVIVLVTGGMESNTSFQAYETGWDNEIQQTKLTIGRTIDQMVKEANAANFTIHVVNARTREMIAPQHDVQNKSSGLPPNLFLTGGGNEPVDTSDLDSTPLTIAAGTGGSYLTSNALRDSLDTIHAQTSSYYSLGYTPPHEDDRQYHRIAVKVNRPGVRIAHRLGYLDLTPEDRLEQFLRARLSMDSNDGTLPVSVEVGRTMTGEASLVVPVTAALPMGKVTVIPADGKLAGRVHVYVSVFDAEGNNIGFDHHLQEVRLSPFEYEHAGLFRYTMRVRLAKGAFKVLVTLRDDLSNEIGSAVQALQL